MNATPLNADGLRAVADHLRYFVPSASKIADDLSKYALLIDEQQRELELRKEKTTLDPGNFSICTCARSHVWAEYDEHEPFKTCPHCEIADLRAKLAADAARETTRQMKEPKP